MLERPKLTMEKTPAPEKLDPYSMTHFGRTGSNPTVITETWAGSCAARSVMSYVMGMCQHCSCNT